MPTYDYVCEACSHEMEAFQSITSKPLRKCPSCGHLKLRRQIGSGGAVIFKGSGFYQTDYRSKSYTDGANKDKPASSSDSSPKKGDPKKNDSSSSGSAVAS